MTIYGSTRPRETAARHQAQQHTHQRVQPTKTPAPPLPLQSLKQMTNTSQIIGLMLILTPLPSTQQIHSHLSKDTTGLKPMCTQFWTESSRTIFIFVFLDIMATLNHNHRSKTFCSFQSCHHGAWPPCCTLPGSLLVKAPRKVYQKIVSGGVFIF